MVSEKEISVDYRKKIYSKYRTVQALPPKIDFGAADRWGQAYEVWLRGWLPEDKHSKILDVACGNGLLLRFFNRNGYDDLEGVDLSEEQLTAAKQICGNIHEKNAIEFLASRAGEYDLICSIDLVEHLYKDEFMDFLENAYGALKPGGRIILQTPNCGSPFGIVQRYSDFTHETGFTPQTLGGLLGLAGFQEVEAREQGPVIRGVKSLLRSLLWKIISAGFKVIDLVETGASKSIYTRVFVISAKKPGA